MLVPLYGFLQGDSIGLLVLAHDHHRIADVAAMLQQAASVRIAPRAGARVIFAGVTLDPEITVARAGLKALDRVDVVGVEE